MVPEMLVQLLLTLRFVQHHGACCETPCQNPQDLWNSGGALFHTRHFLLKPCSPATLCYNSQHQLHCSVSSSTSAYDLHGSSEPVQICEHLASKTQHGPGFQLGTVVRAEVCVGAQCRDNAGGPQHAGASPEGCQ